MKQIGHTLLKICNNHS